MKSTFFKTVTARTLVMPAAGPLSLHEGGMSRLRSGRGRAGVRGAGCAYTSALATVAAMDSACPSGM